MSDSEFGPPPPPPLLPVAQQAVLRGHGKAVSALSLDTSGSRLATGSHDHSVKLWDFAGMDRSLQSFRTVTVCEGHPIRSVQFSEDSRLLLVGTSDCRAVVLDREGFRVSETVAGDMYIRNARGHTSALSAAVWANSSDRFLTASVDGTMRLWAVDRPEHSVAVFHCSPAPSKRVQVGACAYSDSVLAGGCSDGAVRLFDASNARRVVHTLSGAHCGEVTGLLWGLDGHSLYSRGLDGLVKAWDTRKTATCTAQHTVETRFPESGLSLSGDGEWLILGDSEHVLALSTAYGLEEVSRVTAGTGVVRALLHPVLFQLVAACSDGTVRIWYDPDTSRNGALLCAHRDTPKRDESDRIERAPVVLDRSRKKRPAALLEPDRPVRRPGGGSSVHSGFMLQ
jgi:WD40 repeat protein